MTKDEPEELIMMLPKELFVRIIAEDLQDRTMTATVNDEFAQSIKKCLTEKAIPPLRTTLSDWTLDNELILFKGKAYIPPNTDLHRDIIKEYHESPTSGHPGFFKTLALLKEHYWWPSLSQLVKKFINSCTACQQMKSNTHPTAAPLMPILSQAHRPFQQITMDFITDLPPQQRF